MTEVRITIETQLWIYLSSVLFCFVFIVVVTLVLVLVLVFQNKVSLGSPGISSLGQASLKLRDIHLPLPVKYCAPVIYFVMAMGKVTIKDIILLFVFFKNISIDLHQNTNSKIKYFILHFSFNKI